MNTYYLREYYFATGEGISNFIIVGQADNKEDFLNLCYQNGIEQYYIQFPDVFVEIANIPLEELEMIKNEHPSLYNRIINKYYEKGTFWWCFKEHLNMS